MKAARVLHVVLKGDGITEVVAEDINIGLAEAGYEVTMLYLRDKGGKPNQTVAAHSIHLGLSTPFRFLFDWAARRRLSQILREGHYDVVLSHRYKPCMLLMNLVRRFPDTQFVNVVHGTGHYDKAARKRAIGRLAHPRFTFVCVSEAVADFVKNRCAVANTPSPVVVMPNGIDIKQLGAIQVGREEARRHLGLDPQSTWIGFVGRLVEIKGVRELIEGFAQIEKQHPSAKLAIVGKGDLREELARLIDRHSLRDKVLLVGQVPQARRFFKAFDAFVLPSYREGMSIALLEAMASGLPLLVSDIPMNASLAPEGTIMFPPKNVDALASALDSFFQEDRAKHLSDGMRNYRLATEKYDITIFRRNYASLIGRLAGQA